MNTELKPCPFCGGEAEITQYGDSRKSTQYECTDCGCRLETGEEFNHGAAWNTRANGDQWISVDDRLPIDYMNVDKYETMKILIVSGGEVEFCEFSCGNLPEPWYKFEDFHKAFVTHWQHLPENN